jgi:hypothetical protein
MQLREESCKRQLCGGKMARLGNRWVWNGMPVRKIAKQKLQRHSEEGGHDAIGQDGGGVSWNWTFAVRIFKARMMRDAKVRIRTILELVR